MFFVGNNLKKICSPALYHWNAAPKHQSFFPVRFDNEVGMRVSMDKTTKMQLSIMFFVIGLAMIFMQDLKRLDTINLGFSLPFAIMFYIGLIFMVIGYYLK